MTHAGGGGTRTVLLVGPPDWVRTVEPRFGEPADEWTFVTAPDVAGALDELRTETRTHDCVVTAHDLEGGSGFDLLDPIESESHGVPVVYAPTAGSETIAARALDRGVDSYVVPGPDGRDIGAVVRRAIDATRRERERRRAADRFEAVFEGTPGFVWVLDADGIVRESNGRVPSLTGENGGGSSDDVPIWDRSFVQESDATEVESAVTAAAEGDRRRFETAFTTPEGRQVPVEVVALPVRNRNGAVEGVVFQGFDVARRSQLESELRRSERLHRVTLNNMTDTVLVTDDDGAFTYVCPNVHFIFGYSAEEIHELGSIDELLGPDLFDPAELTEEGVLTNIECTTTDRSGAEHHLLVNVKEVSIQGGTRLYSCRDVTKRRKREEALATLQGTARDLLYADNEHAIAGQLVEDATEVLDLPAVGVYLYDNDENVLAPTAARDELRTAHGPLSDLTPGPNSLVGHAFIEGRTVVRDDVREDDRNTNPVTDLRSALLVPLGEYGVLLAGDTRVGVVDEVTTELADILATTAEAALERVERESALRERDAELQRRNARLTELDRINGIIREIDQELVRAESREEIEHAVCERLTSAGRFGLAWVDRRETDDRLRTHAWAGTGRGLLDAFPEALGSRDDPTARTARTGEPTVVPHVAENLRESDWRKEALTRGHQSVVSVPLSYEGATYGTLTVVATEPDAFDERARTVLTELGETAASAIGSVMRRDALLGGTVTELSYATTDRDCVLFELASRLDCEVRLEGEVQRSSDGVLVFVGVDGAPAELAVETAAELVSVTAATPVVDGEDGGTIQLEIAGPFIATTLADHGAVLRTVTATPEEASFTVDVPGRIDVRTVDEVVSNTYDDVDLRAQQERDHDGVTTTELRSELVDRLTDRQLEAVQTAYHSGFFESPRETTGEEVAEVLGISPTAFYQLNRKVQRKLFTRLFDDGD